MFKFAECDKIFGIYTVYIAHMYILDKSSISIQIFLTVQVRYIFLVSMIWCLLLGEMRMPIMVEDMFLGRDDCGPYPAYYIRTAGYKVDGLK